MKRSKAREETVRVRFTVAELEPVRRAAAAEGVPLSTYLRRLAITSRAAPGAQDERVRRALEALGSLSKAEADELREDVRELRGGWDRRGRR